MTEIDPRHVRALMRGTHPFLPGRYPGRPTPQHVLNAFVLAGLGSTSGADAIRLMSRDSRSRGVEHRASGALREHPAVEGQAWAEDESLLRALSSTILAVFDPDGQIFPTRGSPLPIDYRAASSDPSDDGLGRALWRVLTDPETETRPKLAQLLDATRSEDAASRLAAVLLPVGPPQPAPDDEAGDPEPRVNTLTDHPLTPILEHVLLGPLLAHAPSDGRRLVRIRQLATALYFGATIGVLLEGIRGNGSGGGLGVIVYPGTAAGSIR